MFNEEKATELAACILSWGGSMKFIKLLKLGSGTDGRLAG